MNNNDKTKEESTTLSIKKSNHDEISQSKSSDNTPEPLQTSSSSSSCMPHKRGNIPMKFDRRKKMKGLREDKVEELDIMLNADSGESPLILFELSRNEWEKIQPNSIDLKDVYIEKPEKKSILHQKILYKSYNFGNNITSKFQHNTYNHPYER